MKFDDSTISKNKSIAAEFFRAYQAVKSEKKSSTTNEKIEYPGGTTGFIPFNIEFTIDGISGIKIYDKLVINTSFLPLGYPKVLEFIVTGVNHSLKDGDWETKIKTTLIPKFDETNETITAADANLLTYKKTPPNNPSNPVTISSLNITTTDGATNGTYISPAKKANAADGTNYVDVSKTLNDKTLKELAKINGGLYPIKLYTKPGDSSGIKYAKVIGFNGDRNLYEKNLSFESNHLVPWSYKGSSGLMYSAQINKLWVPTLTQMAQLLDDKGMWNNTHIKSWSPGIVYRDVTPANGIIHGLISAHAFGMAIDINSGQYPVGKGGVTKWETDFNSRVPTALVHQVLNENFVLTQGGAQKVFWLKNSKDVHHFSVYVEK